MTTNNPLISVCIPTYNCAKYLSQSLGSVYAQNYDNLEIIVIDDGSDDNTKEVLQNYKDIKYIYQDHKGIATARNTCIQNATGEYIAFLDADDYWTENKLNTQIQYFKDNPECEIVFSAYNNFLEDESLRTNKKIMEEFVYEKRNKFMLSASLIKKSVFEKYGSFTTNFKHYEDTEFIFMLKSKGVNLNHYIDKVFFKRRLHAKNTTFVIAEKHEKLFKGIFQFLRQDLQKKNGNK